MKKLLVMAMLVAIAKMCFVGGGDSYNDIDNTNYTSSTYNTSYEENNSYNYETTENITVNEYETATVVEETAPTQRVARSSEDSIAVGIDMLEESMIYYESDLYNYIGEPIAIEGNVYYFHIQTLFEKSGIMAVEVHNGRVIRSTWTYKFVNVVDDSETFYNDIINMKNRMPYTNIIVERDYESGDPRVSITVWNDMI